ncbi:MAG: Tol-Pal system beta propeller repeat protein TolB [Deltaproteobacteria bacterium]|nr:Tol-Pal system beta propeller repeat protein TolB [Deltaproteobacteria bacterium]
MTMTKISSLLFRCSRPAAKSSADKLEPIKGPFSGLSLFNFLAVLFILAGIISPLRANGDDRVYINIDSPYMRQFPIAIPDFRGADGSRGDSSSHLPSPEILSNDLNMTGYFKVLDPRTFVEKSGSTEMDASDISFRDWSFIGAELLVKGTYEVRGSDLVVEARLYDVFKGSQVLGKRYTGDVKDHRRIIHRLANDIMEALTGRKGFFDAKIAFVSARRGNKEIYVTDFDGSDVRQLTDLNSISLSVRWAPDGRRIAYASYASGQPSIYIQDTSSGAKRKLATRASLNISPAWSPDGNTLAISMNLDGSPNIYLIDTNGGVLKRLTDNRGIDVSPCFSPDGRKITFVSNRSGGPQVYVMDADGSNQHRITFSGDYNTAPSWSPKGDRIAYTGRSSSGFNIFSVSPEGSGVTQLTSGRGDNQEPAWSPDGSMIAFSSSRAGAAQIYMMRATGENPIQVTTSPGEQSAPNWSPAGK